MKKMPFIGTIILLFVLAACTKNSDSIREDAFSTEKGSQGLASFKNQNSSMDALLKSVRSATARFHSTTQALKAGYDSTNHCVSVPGLGGMGYHWVNSDLVDPFFDPLKPEAILYAKGPGGKLRMIALEYIVINAGQPAPMFGSQSFDVGGTPVPAPHWSLHVWLYEDNPAGMFIPFNPNVTCN